MLRAHVNTQCLHLRNTFSFCYHNSVNLLRLEGHTCLHST